MKAKPLLTFCLSFVLALKAAAQGTAFTYQGQLTENGTAANGNYELRFVIFNAAIGGSQVGNPLTNAPVTVKDGAFTVVLDFGEGIFTGANRWLQIGVRTNGSSGAFTSLSPLQPFTAAPYAITAAGVTDLNVSRLDVLNTAVAATATPTVTSGFITGATLTSGGLGYQTPPAVTVSDSTGTGASITATISDGRVVALIVQNPGTGYSQAATLTISSPPSNAFQTFVTPNFFTSVNTMTNPANIFGGNFSGNGTGLTNVTAATLQGRTSADFWQLRGNSESSAGINFLGTTDDQPLELRVSSARALRLEPNTNGAPNVISGSSVNLVDLGVVGATIAGGGAVSYQGTALTNRISADFGAIAGGSGNQIQSEADHAVIGGGGGNWIGEGSQFSSIGAGYDNVIQTNARYCGVCAGAQNIVSNFALGCTIGGGAQNTIQSAELTPCNFATIPGGYGNIVSGQYTLAAGFQAAALHDGAFVWADSQGPLFSSSAKDQFLIRAAGGVGIGLNHPAGVLSIATGNASVTVRNDNNVADLVMSGGVAPGTLRVRNTIEIWPNDSANAAGRLDVRGLNGVASISLNGANGNLTAVTVTQTSDRNVKDHFTPVDTRALLEEVARLPISRWNFKNAPGIAHLGPMAQDFYAAFGLGTDDKHIATVDEGGVALAALQGLNQKLEEKTARIRELETRLERLEQLLKEKTELAK